MTALTFDAVAEAQPGPKWKARWDRSWPDYEAWFTGRNGDDGPSRAECEAALARHMPELVPVHARLTELAGGGDRAARFLSTWCPPAYLGGCSLAASATDDAVRLVRNYDLSPTLNEGLLLRTEWCRPVMGMSEFLWGLSDGVNDAGLSVALAYGGRSEVGEGFGVTTILRYLLETCEDVEAALEVLDRVPSHMAYNLVLADAGGTVASVELMPGGGVRRVPVALATNHQREAGADRPGFTRTERRRRHLAMLLESTPPEALAASFLETPLYQRNWSGGFGTLFTAEYDPRAGGLALIWPGIRWEFTLDSFVEGRREIRYGEETDPLGGLEVARGHVGDAAAAAVGNWLDTARAGPPDWAALGRAFAVDDRI